LQVIDVGEALEKMLYDDSTASQTYELYGPHNYSMAEIAELVDREIFKRRRHINLPKAILKPVAELLNRVLWWHTLSADEVEREFLDQVIDESAKTFKDLGMEPSDIGKWTYHYLVCIQHYCKLVCLGVADPLIEALPFVDLLRPAARDRKGNAGGEEVHPRS
jgi:NADH dehydrogenase (ubiquinone) 1 alpha subcomplex subunit 9